MRRDRGAGRTDRYVTGGGTVVQDESKALNACIHTQRTNGSVLLCVRGGVHIRAAPSHG